MTRPGLTLDALRVIHAGAPLVALDAHVAPGEVLTVMGPSGVGKSTLLAAITGTLPPGFRAEGRVVLNGTDITRKAPEHRHVGILFQEELLFPHMSVGGNLAFGLPPTIRGRAARRAKLAEALADVGLDGFADRDPATLSGGQKARVALMRMLLSEPRALLLDEAFSRLDAALRDQIRHLVFARAKARALPVLMVTHDADDARAAGGRVVDLG
ncbi:ATP-binding cassette domain-containing protein [Actibacterium sp. D379-3]